MTLAIFDLDNTLLAGDSDHAWGQFLIDEGLVDADEVKAINDGFYADYQAGKLDIQRYLCFALDFLAHKDPAELDTLHAHFMERCIEPLITDKALSLVDKHRQQGDTLLIITATNRFVTGPIAERLGIDNLIASEAERVDGRYTGKPAGVPSFQEGKITRLNAWLADHHETMDGAWFYSDSHNDLPLLNRVDHPVAVDPDDTLRAMAEQNAWPIISLRE